MEESKVKIYTLKLSYYCLRTKTLGHYSSLENARASVFSYMSDKDDWIEEKTNYWLNSKSKEELEISIGDLDPDTFYDSD